MIGKTISHYKIIEKLGEGGMGVVYKATDITLERTVALKFVLAAASLNDATRKRLIREAKACAALNHPNITTVYEFSEDGGRSFIAMEYIEGDTLQQLITEKKYTVDEVIEIVLQAVNGLSLAHKNGIIHRDLKSSNIMIDSNGWVKIMDFGLAKLSGSSILTQEGVTLGTAAYMSPEQAQGHEIDHRSDIYSMGVVLYQLLTGELPFNESHHLAVMYCIVNEQPKKPSELDPDIPEELESVVLKMMQKIPEDRYQELGEVHNELIKLQKTLGKAKVAEPADSDRKKATSAKTTPFQKYLIAIFIILAGIAVWLVIKLPAWNEGKGRPTKEIALAHVNLAQSYLNENKPNLAKQELEKAVAGDSTNSVAWSSLAALNIQAQKLDIAIDQSKKAIKYNSQNKKAYYNLAYALEEKGQFNEAIQFYSQAITVDSTFTQAYSALANLYIELKQLDEALGILNKAIKISPNSEYNFLVYKNLGKAHYFRKAYDKAITHLSHSIELQPLEVSETIYLLALTHEAKGMNTESVKNLERFIQITSDSLKKKDAIQRLQKLSN